MGKVFLLSNAEDFIGKSLGVSNWVTIDQVQVNIFGEVSRWRKPGHCDPESAKDGPYGGTLMHGFHMVSLLSHFFEDSGSRPADGSPCRDWRGCEVAVSRESSGRDR